MFCFHNAQAEKLTQEQVLEELGVKIKSKGKQCFHYYFNSLCCIYRVRRQNLYIFITIFTNERVNILAPHPVEVDNSGFHATFLAEY